ncbi:MurR/RpiR family transcriptional regulator [Paenibacillus apiarius]|uniref:MurR/RpiR family transcriptional regulator n=1 Tax=Paenibacillus apiarius TaxID=46240 RepID=A0ABT4DUK2_9BACL|nr:MurR/RpiR family transcriptional regulator [Paenibacillus apiarius]MCY9514471.1 MurR/RpiR family transcriptional regulator [Paenibacillus apiarius]MCY9520991.1 MurR/RpiR family transcriptional regulator [Paenibacillus apiarius]MCY9551838.1 MurR/RpiR family transcriptional regulator [Paenibacillus apiarius]MCY9557725.1 MurR/RpiR family transcriptional regulator [Paenibacillus apiarius]MCY9684412.1 MurR/RpiR family transcriptional regulator [Paenibacillus apiarius]
MIAGEHTNTLLLTRSLYPSLTKTEKKIADYVLKDPDSVLYATVTDLAEKADAGETSVLRFCRNLGFKSYQDFKLSLAKDLVTLLKQQESQIEESDDLSSVAQKMTMENIASLEHTLSLLNMNELQKAVDAILKARRLFFMGVGSSAMTAMDAQYRFMRLGFVGEAVTDPHVMAMNATLMSAQDVVFGISTSGSTKDLVDAVRLAKENNVHFICLTSHAKSPITKFADSILLIRSRETPLQGGAFSSKMGQIHVLDILSTAVALQAKEKTCHAIQQTAKSVLDKLY